MNRFYKNIIFNCLVCIPSLHAFTEDNVISSENPQIQETNGAFPTPPQDIADTTAQQREVSQVLHEKELFLQQLLEEQATNLALYEQEKNRLTQEKTTLEQQHFNLNEENVRLADFLKKQEEKLNVCEQEKNQLIEKNEATQQQKTELEQVVVTCKHKNETLKQKNTELEENRNLYKSYWKIADKLLNDASSALPILFMQNKELSSRITRYKMAFYGMAFTNIVLIVYTYWNTLQKSWHTVRAHLWNWIHKNKVNNQRKKIEEDLLVNDLQAH